MIKRNILECMTLVGKAPSHYEGAKTYVSTGAVDCDHIDYKQTEQVTYDNRPSRANLSVTSGDILFAKMCGTKKTLRINDVMAKYLFSTGFCAVRANESVMIADLLYHLLSSEQFLTQKDQNSSGATQKAITNTGLKKITIQVPDLEEQRVLAAKLDCIEQMMARRRIQIEYFDQLVKSRFIEMFGDPEWNPKGYEKRKLGLLAKKISDGVHSKPEYTETGRPFLSVVNINKGVINFEGCKFVSEEAYQKMIKSTRPERGDILYTKVGATYGIPAYVDTNTEFCLYVSVCLIKPKHDAIDSRFLALSMSMPYIKRQADSRIKGIGVPDLHLNQISEFDILCPSRKEQEAFVSFTVQTDKSKLAIQESLKRLEILKKALMQKYFG